METKVISPQNLFIRFVASFVIVLFFNHFQDFERIFALSLAQTLIFSLFMMIFYSNMVKYLVGKEHIQLSLALLCRYGYFICSFICFNLFFRQPLAWLVVEVLVGIFTKGGKPHDR